ncbi:MAG: hypothetical protein ACLQDL_13370 [Spirochaetia bacterium]
MHGLVVAQDHPLPIWQLVELEFLNALRSKVFLAEMGRDELERLISLYRDRKRIGQYFVPHLDPIVMHELCLHLTEKTPAIGCRTLDILHVAAARLCGASAFITADKRQALLAEAEEWDFRLVSG